MRLPGQPIEAARAGVQLDLDDARKEADIEAQKEAAAFVDAPAGNGNGVAEPVKVVAKAASGVGPGAAVQPERQDTMDLALGQLSGDAPLCETCGHITVRNGSCYRCLNCGNSMGCS